MDTQALWLGAAFGLVAGVVLAWWWMRGEMRTQRRRAEALDRDRDRLRKRVDELQTEIGAVLESAALALASAVTEAERAGSERGTVDDNVSRAVEDLTTEVGEGERASAEWREAATESADQTAAELESQEHALSGELDGLQRLTGNLAEWLDSASSNDKLIGARTQDLVTVSSQSVDLASAMDEVIHRVRSSASETLELSEQMNDEAERGYRAVHRTLDEIERIRDLTGNARDRITALGARVADIGHVVKVIHDITEKTNLLALNASIIAAQAGERGRSFAVVAQEIKALAQRTAASTKEISEQVRGIQGESERATAAMDDGVAAVGEGFQVAIAAGDALGAIRQSARTAQKRVQSITRGLKQQTSVARQVMESANAVAETAASLATLVRGQSEAAERLRTAALDVRGGAKRIAELVRDHEAASERRGDAWHEVVEQLARLAERERHVRQRLARMQGELTRSRGYSDALEAHWGSVNEATTQLRDAVARLQK